MPVYKSRTQLAREKRLLYTLASRAEGAYARALRKIAAQVDSMVKAMGKDPDALRDSLRKYAGVIRPWAKAVAQTMLADVSRRDEKVWIERTRGMARDLRKEIARAPTGKTMRRLME